LCAECDEEPAVKFLEAPEIKLLRGPWRLLMTVRVSIKEVIVK
jgi:hypothetical protein